MSNTHLQPDSFFEQMCTWGDLGPQVVVSHSGLTVPAASLTLSAVAASGYVLATGPPARLVYVSQPAVSLTISGGNGQYWLALHTDLSTPVAGWTRRSGSHFIWQLNATQPSVQPPNGLMFAQITVAGGVITAVTPISGATSQPMSQQKSSAVTITGGTASLARLGVSVAAPSTDGSVHIQGIVGIGVPPDPALSLTTAFAASIGTTLEIGDTLGVGTAPSANVGVGILYASSTNQYGITLRPTLGGAATPVVFTRWDGAVLTGTITTTDTSTSYNTTSDARLKEAMAPLREALPLLARLNPVTFRWKADGSPGVGLLAHEVAAVVPGVVSGEAEAVTEDGAVLPQGIDYSKLVPYLVGACQELAQQVQALTARLRGLEDALGG